MDGLSLKQVLSPKYLYLNRDKLLPYLKRRIFRFLTLFKKVVTDKRIALNIITCLRVYLYLVSKNEIINRVRKEQYEETEGLSVTEVWDRRDLFNGLSRIFSFLDLKTVDDAVSTFGWGDVGKVKNNLHKFPKPSASNRLLNFEDVMGLFFWGGSNRGIIRMTLDEAALLFKVAREVALNGTGTCRVLDIGRFRGGSAVLLGSAVAGYGEVDSIDPYPEDDKSLIKLLEKLGISKNVRVMVDDSNNFVPAYKYDLIFVDGDHEYHQVKSDLEKFIKYLNAGGLIAFHDMDATYDLITVIPGPTKLFREALSASKDLELCARTGCLCIFRQVGALQGHPQA